MRKFQKLPCGVECWRCSSPGGCCADATTQRTPSVKAAVHDASVVRRATGGVSGDAGAKWNHSDSMAAFSTAVTP